MFHALSEQMKRDPQASQSFVERSLEWGRRLGGCHCALRHSLFCDPVHAIVAGLELERTRHCMLKRGFL
jgi:hypothetical protein